MPARPSPPRLTHFLAIPLVTAISRPQLQHSLRKFKDAATQPNFTSSLPEGIPDQAIRPLETLHLTLGVMSLLTLERVAGVLDLLQSLDLEDVLAGVKPAGEVNRAKDSRTSETKTGGGSQVSREKTEQRPIFVTLQGLHSMHSPVKTSVLYASPLDPDLRLYRFCTKLREVFKEFLVSESRPLLLHATIVNTIYAKGLRKAGGSRGGRGGRGGMKKERLELDAREVVREWENFTWMESVRVEKVALLKMGAKVGEGSDEKYEVEGDVDMPES
ncbi:uncharacterized protein RSE6_01264 [Rhynchosporium secalis]|uniref:A-kinase anchor protein 7-like phosphoesterase domain-containing protein n=1 Tax=Rhynchosporium secalis TaxID=38038 RepID=A0A1E1LXB8_RHYSE|nr:uncharacterized protein RSE6_01264 [Rhynchosporium secalis]